jgi:hypothetical protein
MAKQTPATPPVWKRLEGNALLDTFCAVVVMVRVEVTGPVLGVTAAGAKVQVASDGRVPQENVTAVLKPKAGVTVKTKVADWPAVMVALVGEAATE